MRLLFLDLFLLGIDSAFAFNEAISTVISDTRFFYKTPKWKVQGCICIAGFLFSIMYATDAGLNFLDVIDFYINFVMLLVGFFECFAAGWIYNIDKTMEKCGKPAVLTYILANFGSVILACGIWFGIPADDGGVWGGFVALVLFYSIFLAISLFFLKQHTAESGMSWGSALWALSFEGVVDLKERIEPVCQWIPFAWCFLIKQFIPHILIILFINLAQSEASTGEPIFGGYGGYQATPFQAMGILTFVFTLVTFTIGFIFPQVYEPLALPPGHFALAPEENIAKDNSAEDTRGSPSESNEEELAEVEA